jgi:catechol 2,3-dioxygenase
MAFPTHGLSHIQLAVRDLARSVAFYEGLLGAQVLRRIGHSAMLRTPGTHEVITLNADPEHAPGAGQSGGVAHFGFRLRERADMEAVLAEVVRLGGAAITHGASTSGDRLYAFAHDPDGYEVELFWESE